MAMELQDRYAESLLVGHLAARAAENGDDVACATWILQRLPLLPGSRSWHGDAFALMLSGVVALHHGGLGLAARLHGALLPMVSVLTGALGSRDRVGHESGIDVIRTRLGSERFGSEVQRGSQLSILSALGEALPLLTTVAGRSGGSTTPEKSGESTLTTREREVLGCLAEAMSNKGHRPAAGRFAIDRHAPHQCELPQAGRQRAGRGRVDRAAHDLHFSLRRGTGSPASAQTVDGGIRSPRFSAKNARSKALHSAAATPGVTGSSWLSRGSAQRL